MYHAGRIEKVTQIPLCVLRTQRNWAEKASVWLPRVLRDICLGHYSLRPIASFIYTDGLVLSRVPSPFSLLPSPHILTSSSQNPSTRSQRIYHVGRGDI